MKIDNELIEFVENIIYDLDGDIECFEETINVNKARISNKKQSINLWKKILENLKIKSKEGKIK